jgi:hypothetical protein
MRIDHVIYGTADLDAAQARMEGLGLTVLDGGHHVGQGTCNRIIPLGNAYLELMAFDDRAEAAASPIGSVLLDRLEVERFMGWAVNVEDVPAVAARLGTPVRTIEREGLFAHLTGIEQALREPTLPFFLQGSARPGEGGRGEFTWIEVAGSPARLREWLDGGELPVRVVEGEPAVRAIGIGDRELRP